MEQCKQGKSAKWIRNLGKRIGLRGGHEGPSPELVRNGPFWASSPGVEQSNKNWYGQGESNYLIKTKHCDAPCGC
uniref:Uncharacterized protein n=1 Tax=Cajanus cajan TaxID=3821 RepID=A0A151UG07_CAJCA